MRWLSLLALLASVMIPLLADDPERVDLWQAGAPGAPPARNKERVLTEDGWTRSTNIEVPYFTVHRAPEAVATGTGVLIVPGGGYSIVAFDHEGIQVARWLNERGIHAFVLRYRHGDDRHPAPLKDVLRALRVVRSKASAYQLHPDRIGVLGFSAGGHLASCAATLFDDPAGRGGDALDATSARPDFAILIYPVIDLAGAAAHAGSRDNLLGPSAPPELVEQMSTHRRVTPQTPPLFLLHAADDNVVPVENIRLMDQAARDAGVATELHIFAQGGHGFGMRADAGPIGIWPELALGWLRVGGFVP